MPKSSGYFRVNSKKQQNFGGGVWSQFKSQKKRSAILIKQEGSSFLLHNLVLYNNSQAFSLHSSTSLRIKNTSFLLSSSSPCSASFLPLSFPAPHHKKTTVAMEDGSTGLEGQGGDTNCFSPAGSHEMLHAKPAFSHSNSHSQTWVTLSPSFPSPRPAQVSVWPAQHAPHNGPVWFPEFWQLIWRRPHLILLPQDLFSKTENC